MGISGGPLSVYHAQAEVAACVSVCVNFSSSEGKIRCIFKIK